MAACRPWASGMRATTQSVVSTSAAIDAAFCKAVRVTLQGSRMPISTRSPNTPVAALKPVGCEFVNHSASAHHRACLRSSANVVAFGTCVICSSLRSTSWSPSRSSFVPGASAPLPPSPFYLKHQLQVSNGSRLVRIQQFHTDLRDFYLACKLWQRRLPGQSLPISAIAVPGHLLAPGCSVQLDLCVCTFAP